METIADLEYEERGRGSVVCLVHAGVHSAWFAPLFAAPALDRFRVIRPIRPGYGRNAAPAERASLDAHAHACGRLLRELGVDRAYWVGHSSSCCMGLQLALDDPDLIAGLVLYEPAKPSGRIRSAHASTYVGPAMAAAGEGDVPRAFDLFLRGVGDDGYRAALVDRLGEDGTAAAVRESAYFFADELPAVGAWSFDAAEAARIPAPTLVVRGADSRPWFGENVDLLAGMLPDARVVTLPGDHLSPFTRPGDLAGLIAAFVDSGRTIGPPA
jgi:pimeloyl-ACP methyl ester carboxylesterase